MFYNLEDVSSSSLEVFVIEISKKFFDKIRKKGVASAISKVTLFDIIVSLEKTQSYLFVRAINFIVDVYSLEFHSKFVDKDGEDSVFLTFLWKMYSSNYPLIGFFTFIMQDCKGIVTNA